MKANYENNPLIQEGKERAKKYEHFKQSIENAQETEWTELDKGTQIDSGMTLYDMAKQGAAIAPPLTEEQISAFRRVVADFISTKSNRYYMMLCNEFRDYTLFDKNGLLSDIGYSVADDILDCMKNRKHQIVEWEDQEDAIEIWIQDEKGGAAAYYLFPYDRGVITYY